MIECYCIIQQQIEDTQWWLNGSRASTGFAPTAMSSLLITKLKAQRGSLFAHHQ
jgi:hypothetical protein